MEIRRYLAAVAGMMILSQTAMAGTVDQSLRPQMRSGDTAEAVIIVAGDPAQVSSKNMGFQRWLQGFRKRAHAKGISDRTLDRAFRGVRYNADVIQKDRNQSEFTKTLWEYLDSAASDTRVKNGKKALRQHSRTLRAIEAKYGVDKEVVAAVWGLESAYGSYRGSINVIEALAKLAYDGRRGRFFEAQLIAALKILQSGDTSPHNMTGSWAGAMGHTQFIPTSYQAFAVDFTGDGRRDIWSDDPSDALASTAAYLARHGWIKGQPWGIEVQLPSRFNYELANRKIKKMPSEWARMGVTDMNGRPVRDAFLIFKNFSVIERYNTADAYVIGVGHLSDRLKGGPKIKSKWPRGDRALTFAERKEMQKLLTKRGFDTKGVDGKIGPLTIQALRGYQRTIGMQPDGYSSLNTLQRLRRN